MRQEQLPSNPACCCSTSSKSMSWKFSASSYAMIDIPETKNIHKINQTEQQTQEFQQYDAMAR
jgi:hypothetical protein